METLAEKDLVQSGMKPHLISYSSIWVFPKIGVPPKSSILIEFSIRNHPFWGTPIFGNTHISFKNQF